MKLLVASILVTFALSALGDSDDQRWANFKVKFNKIYSPREEAQRRTVFVQTQRAIEKHNSGDYSWKMDHNEFSDMTQQEREARLGLKPLRSGDNREHAERSFEVADRALPAYFDYRQSGCIPPIKDQGACGSCWAFAAITPLEYALCMRNNEPVSLSEQQLVSCDPLASGCNGGSNPSAWNYLKTNGLVTSCAYPYTSGKTSQSGTCIYENTMSVVKVATYGWADPNHGAGVNATAIAQSLLQYGPLGAGFAVINSFFSYSSGVYDDPACNNVAGGNHAVVIVGFGTSDEGIPYWIVRNSWGFGFGQRGYFTIRRGVNRCLMEESAEYVTIV